MKFKVKNVVTKDGAINVKILKELINRIEYLNVWDKVGEEYYAIKKAFDNDIIDCQLISKWIDLLLRKTETIKRLEKDI